MRRLGTIGAATILAACVTLALAGGAGARPAVPLRTQRTAANIKSVACNFLEGVDAAHLAGSVLKFVREGEFEASALILFGVNQKLCGGGEIEKLFSLTHNFLASGLFHNESTFSRLKAELPSLQSELAALPSLQVATVSVPALTFSLSPVGPRSFVPTTVTWAMSGAATVYIRAVRLSPGSRTQYRRVFRLGTIGSLRCPCRPDGGSSAAVRPRSATSAACRSRSRSTPPTRKP